MSEETVSAIKLVTTVYANIREEIGIIKELTGDTFNEAVENIKAGCLVPVDKEKVEAECCAITLQLSLLDQVDTPSNVRVQETERQAREWGFILETAEIV